MMHSLLAYHALSRRTLPVTRLFFFLCRRCSHWPKPPLHTGDGSVIPGSCTSLTIDSIPLRGIICQVLYTGCKGDCIAFMTIRTSHSRRGRIAEIYLLVC